MDTEKNKETIVVEETKQSEVEKTLADVQNQLREISEIQLKTVETIKKTQDMIIQAPDVRVEIMDDVERFVTDTLNEYQQNPNVKWRYPQDSRKFAVVLQSVINKKDIKEIAEYIR